MVHTVHIYHMCICSYVATYKLMHIYIISQMLLAFPSYVMGLEVMYGNLRINLAGKSANHRVNRNIHSQEFLIT